MSLQNDTYNKLIKEEKLNEQKKYNEFLKEQLSLKKNLTQIATNKNEKKSQNTRMNLEDSKNLLERRTIEDVMIPGIFNLSSIGSKPTCRGGRMIVDSIDLYKVKMDENLGKLKGNLINDNQKSSLSNPSKLK